MLIGNSIAIFLLMDDFIDNPAFFIVYGLFFIFWCIGFRITRAKQKKREKYQEELGIDNIELKEAIVKCRKRIE